MNNDSKENRDIRKDKENMAESEPVRAEADIPEDETYYDALIKKRIGEALRSEARSEKLDVEVLHAWVAADRRKRAIRRRRYAAVCACVLLVCCAAFGMKTLTDSDDYYAVAGKNDPITSEEDGNTVIKNNEEGVDDTIGEQEVVIENWEHVADAKKLYPELLIPEYVPEGYEFEELDITNTEVTKRFKYIFISGDNVLSMNQSMDVDGKAIKDYNYIIYMDDGKRIMIKEDIQRMATYVLQENDLFVIKGDLEDEDFAKIIENLKR